MNSYPNTNICTNSYSYNMNNHFENQFVIGNNSTPSSPFIHKYTAEKKIFGLSFMNSSSLRIKCAISSMDLSLNNFIQLIEYDNDYNNKQELVSTAKTSIEYPCTKLCWANEKYNHNLLASASDNLRMYYYDEHKNSLSETKCYNSNNKEGPLSALEWNRINQQIIGVASIDTTASIWDIEKETKVSHIIANDKECYDLSFGCQKHCFITCGGDGTIRQFDMRNKTNCWLIYQGCNAIMKSKWNSLNENFVAFTALDDKDVNIIDRRNINTIYSSLKYHTANLNNCIWSPKSNCILLSVSDDDKAVMWDIQNPKGTEAIMEYKSDEGEIDNCDWSEGNDAWIGIACNNYFQMLLLNK